MTGTIRAIADGHRYGSIAAEDGSELFFADWTLAEPSIFHELRTGDAVTFDVAQDVARAARAYANNVRPVVRVRARGSR